MLGEIVDLLFPPACGSCGVTGSGLCPRCAPAGGRCERFCVDGIPVLASGGYEGTLRAAVLSMKRGRRDVAAALGCDLAVRAMGCIPAGAAIVWAPTTRRRVMERGFDQARLLGLSIARASGSAPVEGLKRTAGAAQRGRSRLQRLSAAGRFLADPRALYGFDRVVLVDDVVTTGATLRDARDALASIGVSTALALAVAHAR